MYGSDEVCCTPMVALPTKLDKIKNFSHQVRGGGVIGLSPDLPGG